MQVATEVVSSNCCSAHYLQVLIKQEQDIIRKGCNLVLYSCIVDHSSKIIHFFVKTDWWSQSDVVLAVRAVERILDNRTIEKWTNIHSDWGSTSIVGHFDSINARNIFDGYREIKSLDRGFWSLAFCPWLDLYCKRHILFEHIIRKVWVYWQNGIRVDITNLWGRAPSQEPVLRHFDCFAWKHLAILCIQWSCFRNNHFCDLCPK